MVNRIKIKNFKSILAAEFELGRVNVLIGENGSGKSNFLEAIAMLCSSKDGTLSPEGLINRGVRVAKPNLTFSSFYQKKPIESIKVEIEIRHDNQNPESIMSEFTCEEPNNIFTKWIDKEEQDVSKEILKFIENLNSNQIVNLLEGKISQEEMADVEFSKEEYDQAIRQLFPNIIRIVKENIYDKYILEYLIYSLSSNALRGYTNLSKKIPLGINGEGLDILLSSLNADQLALLKEHNFIGWMDDFFVDNDDSYKFEGHKLGRSASKLYFLDKYMRKNNNIFSSENANEGALFIVFYLALFISDKTPKFFAIENIETALNPRLCRELIKTIVKLSKKTNRQVIITTHNPAVLDGLNLYDNEQKLFVVKRTDEGYSKIENIKFKSKEDSIYKLSELWMRNYFGGLANF